jgi:ribosome-associated protein
MDPIDGHHRTPQGRQIRAAAIEWQASRSGGPGGQHANTSDTAVTVTIHVERCGLPAVVQQRVLERVGPVVVASSAHTRSQWRNRQLAWNEALVRLDEAAQPPPAPRARTRPGRGAREERLADKRRSAERKRDRRRPGADD